MTPQEINHKIARHFGFEEDFFQDEDGVWFDAECKRLLDYHYILGEERVVIFLECLDKIYDMNMKGHGSPLA